MLHKHRFNVILNSDGIIVDIDFDMYEEMVTTEDLIGKNWFDTFISPSDRDMVMSVFKDIISGDVKKWKSYSNDIRFSNGSHQLMDFENELLIKDGKKFIVSKSIPHFENY